MEVSSDPHGGHGDSQQGINIANLADVMTTTEAARWLRVNRTTMWGWVTEGLVKTQGQARGAYLICRQSLVAKINRLPPLP